MAHSDGNKIGIRGNIAAESYKLLILLNGEDTINMVYAGVLTDIDQWDMNDIERVQDPAIGWVQDPAIGWSRNYETELIFAIRYMLLFPAAPEPEGLRTPLGVTGSDLQINPSLSAEHAPHRNGRRSHPLSQLVGALIDGRLSLANVSRPRLLPLANLSRPLRLSFARGSAPLLALMPMLVAHSHLQARQLLRMRSAVTLRPLQRPLLLLGTSTFSSSSTAASACATDGTCAAARPMATRNTSTKATACGCGGARTASGG